LPLSNSTNSALIANDSLGDKLLDCGALGFNSETGSLLPLG
jgi:hypothetical protein